MKKGYSIILFLLMSVSLSAVEWQWSVKVRDYVSSETGDYPDAFLWIPPDCKQVRAVVFGQHNMCEETIFEHPEFRETMADLGFAIIWVTPGFEQQWNESNGCREIFNGILENLSSESGYTELKHLPVVPLGHSAMATFPWNFAAWNPERTLAVVSYHGDAPRTNLTGYGGENIEWGRTRNIDGIPGLIVIGEHEWWEARVNPALAFRMMYPESCISFLCDAGYGHFDVSDDVVDYICTFLKKAAFYRLPDKPEVSGYPVLRKVDIKEGWLAERWSAGDAVRSAPAPFPEYNGDSHDSFWYFDEEMAEKTETYYKRTRNKKEQYLSFTHNGNLVAFNTQRNGYYLRLAGLAWRDDGVTFNLSAAFSDSLHLQINEKNPEIKLSRICGPVKQVNDTTFSLRFYRMGLNNKKRTASIWLTAHHKGNETYKSCVQQINIDFPYPFIEGKEQKITFPEIKDIKNNTKILPLNAFSDSGLPVYYYVKQGPATVAENTNELHITEIPPGTRYPVKVTVTAWQYGRVSGEKIRTASPVERSFYIYK